MEIFILAKNRYYIDLQMNAICRLNNLYIVFFVCMQLKNREKFKKYLEKIILWDVSDYVEIFI